MRRPRARVMGNGSPVRLARRVGSSFDPQNITGMFLWLDPDGYCYSDAGSTLCTNLEGVYRWVSRVSSHWFDQTNAPYRPLWKQSGPMNSQPSVFFDGANDILERVTGVVNAQPNTVAMVVKHSTATGYHFVTDSKDSGSQRHITGILNGNNAIDAGSSINAGAATTDAIVFVGIFNGTSGKIRINGSQTAGTVGTQSWQLAMLGGNYSGGQLYHGEIGELLAYDQEVSGSELTDLENWLATKYGI